jgi:hypothetical protein
VSHTSLIIIISGCFTCNITVIHLFQKYLINFLQKKLARLEKIVNFSDGVSSPIQEKEEFDITKKEAFRSPAEGYFFASSHGESACESLGDRT